VTEVAGLAGLLSAEGWPYASSLPQSDDDPGRFHALFGRDSLITSLQVLPVRPDVARATLRALACLQGTHTDAGTLEAPGKIGHEFRTAPPETFIGWPAGEFRYYATADATSWFLVVLAAVDDSDLADELAAHWRAAADWLRNELDAGGGFIRYAPGVLGGLSHQGWRDAIDPVADGNGGGTLRPDGTRPAPPFADCDSQAVAVAALRATARLTGDDEWSERAAALRARITETFLPDVVMLDADGPISGAGSQLGWLLWCDAVEPDAIPAVAERLCAPDIRTDRGLRTLSSESPVFAEDGYHRGSVWPFDCWLGWGGLRAAGRAAEADAVRRGVLAAIDALGGYPELYAVSRDGQARRIAAANRVQAWTVGARWALANEWDARS
jgi:glycogen debranching enzyme